MLNLASFRAFSNTLFSKTAWIATVALVASLLAVVPVGGQAANATTSVLPTSISVGANHSCVVVSGGVQCWGSNYSGQLGAVVTPSKASSAQVIPSGVGATQVSSGAAHSCAVIAGGVQCWGENGFGQLGDATTTSRALPVTALASNSGATQVSSGSSHSCAVVSGGVQCWGANFSGLLGNGSTVNSSIPVQAIQPGSGATQVSVGVYHSCAVVAGAVKCWGSNAAGQLGDGGTLIRALLPQDVTGLTTSATALSSGTEQTCAIVLGGVQCWGAGVVIQTEKIAAGASVTQIALGEAHACALVDGQVKCWGNNDKGQLGNGTTDAAVIPTIVSELGSAAVLLDAGGRSTCVILEASLKCWGGNSDGELGNDEIMYSTTPQNALNLEGVTEIGAGYYFNCVLTNGAVKCWGYNASGQLGNGTRASSSLPVTAIASGATALSVGYEHACAIVAGGVKCWGEGSSGQLGDWSQLDRTTPVDVDFSARGADNFAALTGPVTAISAGKDQSCAVASVLICWGGNNFGQLGIGRTSFAEPKPLLISGLTGNVTRLALGFQHSCAVDTDGLKCWGRNSYGQIGDGTVVTRLSPVLISGLEVASIATLGSHTCAVLAGVAKCWGINARGQLGDNSTTTKLSPVSVVGVPSGTAALDLGDGFSCALQNAGVQCWGANADGQVGNGSVIDALVATPVSGLSSGVNLMSAGRSHACAVIGATVRCWGRNFAGALGFAHTLFSATPIAATGVFRAAVVAPDVNAGGGGQQAVAVDPATLLKPELAKGKRMMVSIKGQRVTLTGTNLKNVDSILVGSKATAILSSSASELVIDVPADLAGLPQVTLVSKSGIQTVDGVMQIVKPYLARSVKVSSFKGNSLTKASALSIRKSYLRDSSVNTVSCVAVIGKGTSAKAKAATIAKSVSACSTVSGYSVKFSEFKIAVRTSKAPLKTPYVTVTLSRSTPSLVN